MKALVTDANIMFAIIAINMTVIGLTSLAESKTIIGVDYGKFLLKKYKIFGIFRIYYMLIVFAIINIASIFIVVTSVYTYRFVHFWLLLSSLVFAIYYFFSYIIVENKYVKKKIYEEELLGHYMNSAEITTYSPDLKARVANGSRTSRKLPMNLIRYFDAPNSEADQLFTEVFGPESVIYKKNLQKKVLKRIGYSNEPYHYRMDSNGVIDISHEFFQFFRYSQAQDRWLIYALELFRPKKLEQVNSVIYLSNTLRAVSQINTFGNSSVLFTYKFMSYIKQDIEKLFMEDIGNSRMSWKQSMIDELQKQWTIYLTSVLDKDKNQQSSAIMEKHIRVIMKRSSNEYFKAATLIKLLYKNWNQSLNTGTENIENVLLFAIQQYANEYELSHVDIRLFVHSMKTDIINSDSAEEPLGWVRQELFS